MPEIGMDDPVDDGGIVGEQDQPFRILIEPPHRQQLLFGAHRVNNITGDLFRGADHPFWLVECNVCMRVELVHSVKIICFRSAGFIINLHAMKAKAIFCWSGGKDSSLALYRALQDPELEIVALLTTLNQTFRRISMHGVREELLDRQAQSIGLPLIKMFVAEGSNAEYEKNMEALLSEYKEKGVSKVIFGDIFLEDLRAYREQNLSKVGITAEFPLWKEDTAQLIGEFFSLGFRTVICCVNDAYLGEESAGAELSQEFIKALPANVDPCGENGEYHTFCFAGPVFKAPVDFTIGEKVYRPLELKTADGDAGETKGFWFCELL
ncbi:MAG: ATP-binding protein [Bacteroidetes bacterium]|nr:ATP-binding protein [Bacteroidota bacterium]